MRPGSRADHDRFCRTEGWDLVRDARGRPVRRHVTYELALADARVLRTRVSRPVDTTTYGRALWSAILRDQLQVDDHVFWACVDGQIIPDRGSASSDPAPNALPAGLVHQLIHEAGVAEAEVASMTLSEAVSAMTEHWSRPPR